MDPARWDRIEALFHRAAELSAGEQNAFLEEACGDDSGLMAELQAMLDEDARAASLLDRGLADLANRIVGPGAPAISALEFGSYRIKQLLGEGGMGVVYLAERRDLGSLVAIKVLRDAWLSPARSERFRSEQRTLAQLNHPSIARLYDADTLADGTPWFAMEYVDGIPLTTYCRNRAAPVQERLKLFRCVCEAVQHAHSHAIIHRDLKPSNILVRPDGTVRLLDFGIAKQLDTLEIAADQTRTGLHLMTPAYAAPEQVRGERVGIYTDVYALGVILYELLTGRLPLDLNGRTPAEAERMIVEQDPERPAAGADLDVLCLTAMHKDAQQRYRSVEALIRDIDHYLKGEPLEARPDTLHYRLGKFVRRNRRRLVVAGVVLTLIVGLTAYFTVRLAAARNRALAEAERTKRIQLFVLNLFGDQAAGPPDSLRVVNLLDRGVEEARILDQEPDVQAELYQTLGGIFEGLGKLERADTLLTSALERRRARFGRESPEAAATLVAMGLLRVRQARLPDAEKLVREGLELDRRLLPRNDPAVAQALSALGKVLEHKGAYREAVQVLEEAERLQSIPGASAADLAATLNELAITQIYLGQYTVSDSVNRRVLAMHRQIYGARHPLVADDLLNLSAIQFNLGHYPESEAFARQALEINQSWYGKEHPEVASSLTSVGEALLRQNRYDEAAGMLQQALSIQEHVYGKVHHRVALALNELGKVSLQRGRFNEAEAQFRRAADIYREVNGESHYTVAVALANLAGVYLERKQYREAEQLLREVVERFTTALSANHPNTGAAQIRLGRALVRQHKYKEAEAQIMAGYQILVKQVSPAVNWLQWAREDLATIYDAWGQTDRANRFRGELVATRKGSR